MKIKGDFVTNSSSTSFCIFGIETDMDAIYEAMSTLKNVDPISQEMKELEDSLVRLGVKDIVEDVFSREELYEDDIYDIAEKVGLDYYTVDGISYLGLEVSAMKDEQTLGEFKDIVAERLNKIGFKLIRADIRLAEECSYNG